MDGDRRSLVSAECGEGDDVTLTGDENSAMEPDHEPEGLDQEMASSTQPSVFSGSPARSVGRGSMARASPVMGVSALTGDNHHTQARSDPPEDSAAVGGGEHAPLIRKESAGILKLEPKKPRRSSGSSVEFRLLPLERPQPEASPTQSQSDRLSVSFAPDSSTTEQQQQQPQQQPQTAVAHPLQQPDHAGSNGESTLRQRNRTLTAEEDEEDEYSASVSQILERQSSRRGSRRLQRQPSSRDSRRGARRRRSSARRLVSTSPDVVVEVDESDNEEQIFENIRMHKEVISEVKHQPWPMQRKLNLVKQAKIYVAKHEGELAERLAQSRSAKDILARYSLVFLRYWQVFQREFANWITSAVPWQKQIKRIESQFGTAVASYFTFLRWILLMNIGISVLLICFVIIPEILAADRHDQGERKELLDVEKRHAFDLKTMWDFEGILKYSPLFYGYYNNKDKTSAGYRIPFAYFLTGMMVYVFSFVVILKKMADNSRMSKMSSKEDDCTFTWKLFTGWDFMIGHAETALNKVSAINLGFRESLLEERERAREETSWKTIALRILANFSVVILLGSSAYAVILLVARSTEPDATSWYRRNELTLTMTLISNVFPTLFDKLGMLEGYHPRQQLRIQLGRIMALNLLNLYTLIFAQFGRVDDITQELTRLKPNFTIPPTPAYTSMPDPLLIQNGTMFSDITAHPCYDVIVNCSVTLQGTENSTAMFAGGNFTTEFIDYVEISVNSTTFQTNDTLSTAAAGFNPPGVSLPPTDTSDRGLPARTDPPYDIVSGATTSAEVIQDDNVLTPPQTFTTPVSPPGSSPLTQLPTEAQSEKSAFSETEEEPARPAPTTNGPYGPPGEGTGAVFVGKDTIAGNRQNIRPTFKDVDTSETPGYFETVSDDVELASISVTEIPGEDSSLVVVFSTVQSEESANGSILNDVSPSTLDNDRFESSTEAEDAGNKIAALPKGGTTPGGIVPLRFVLPPTAAVPTVTVPEFSEESNELEQWPPPFPGKRRKRQAVPSDSDAISMPTDTDSSPGKSTLASDIDYTGDGGEISSNSDFPTGSFETIASLSDEDSDTTGYVSPDQFWELTEPVVAAVTDFSGATVESVATEDTGVDSTAEDATTDTTSRSEMTARAVDDDSSSSRETKDTLEVVTSTKYESAQDERADAIANDGSIKTQEPTQNTSSPASAEDASAHRVKHSNQNASGTSTSMSVNDVIDPPAVNEQTVSSTSSEFDSSSQPNFTTTSSNITVNTIRGSTEDPQLGEKEHTFGYDLLNETEDTMATVVVYDADSCYELICNSNRSALAPETGPASNSAEGDPARRQALEVMKDTSQLFDSKVRLKLRQLCWETLYGQELMKLIIMDTVWTVTSVVGMEFFRALFVRVMNNCWCWDLERTAPKYADFAIAENILHLVNNQGMIWMGMFFAPGLPAVNAVKLALLMYVRSWGVLTSNVPHEVIFRASRSNNFYFALLLIMLFLCTLPVGYAIVWLEPSWHCGPFSDYLRAYKIFTNGLQRALPDSFNKILDYISSPAIVIPLLVLLVLVIFYQISLAGSLRESNNDLRTQLRRERTEERRKMFKMADSKTKEPEKPFDKWSRLLEGTFNKAQSADQASKRPERTPKEKEDRAKELLLEAVHRRRERIASQRSNLSGASGAASPPSAAVITEQPKPSKSRRFSRDKRDKLSAPSAGQAKSEKKGSGGGGKGRAKSRSMENSQAAAKRDSSASSISVPVIRISKEDSVELADEPIPQDSLRRAEPQEAPSAARTTQSRRAGVRARPGCTRSRPVSPSSLRGRPRLSHIDSQDSDGSTTSAQTSSGDSHSSVDTLV